MKAFRIVIFLANAGTLLFAVTRIWEDYPNHRSWDFPSIALSTARPRSVTERWPLVHNRVRHAAPRRRADWETINRATGAPCICNLRARLDSSGQTLA